MTSPTRARVVAAEKRVGKALVRAVGEHKIPYRIEELAVMARYVVREQLIDWPPLPEFAEQSEPAPRIALPPSDRQLLALVALGLDNAEVAARLGSSERAICTRLRKVYARLGARNRTNAVALGFWLGILDGGGTGVAMGAVCPPAASGRSDRPRGASRAARATGGPSGASTATVDALTDQQGPESPRGSTSDGPAGPSSPSGPPRPPEARTEPHSASAPQTATQAVRA